MTVPLATTTIAVLRLPDGTPEEGDDWPDPYDEQLTERETIESGVRAHISAPSGQEQVAGGEQSVVRFSLACDPIDLRHTDWVLDEGTNVVYSVVWAAARRGLGLEHTAAGLQLVEGAA